MPRIKSSFPFELQTIPILIVKFSSTKTASPKKISKNFAKML